MSPRSPVPRSRTSSSRPCQSSCDAQTCFPSVRSRLPAGTPLRGVCASASVSSIDVEKPSSRRPSRCRRRRATRRGDGAVLSNSKACGIGPVAGDRRRARLLHVGLNFWHLALLDDFLALGAEAGPLRDLPVLRTFAAAFSGAGLQHVPRRGRGALGRRDRRLRGVHIVAVRDASAPPGRRVLEGPDGRGRRPARRPPRRARGRRAPSPLRLAARPPSPATRAAAFSAAMRASSQRLFLFGLGFSSPRGAAASASRQQLLLLALLRGGRSGRRLTRRRLAAAFLAAVSAAAAAASFRVLVAACARLPPNRRRAPKACFRGSIASTRPIRRPRRSKSVTATPSAAASRSPRRAAHRRRRLLRGPLRFLGVFERALQAALGAQSTLAPRVQPPHECGRDGRARTEFHGWQAAAPGGSAGAVVLYNAARGAKTLRAVRHGRWQQTRIKLSKLESGRSTRRAGHGTRRPPRLDATRRAGAKTAAPPTRGAAGRNGRGTRAADEGHTQQARERDRKLPVAPASSASKTAGARFGPHRRCRAARRPQHRIRHDVITRRSS